MAVFRPARVSQACGRFLWVRTGGCVKTCSVISASLPSLHCACPTGFALLCGSFPLPYHPYSGQFPVLREKYQQPVSHRKGCLTFWTLSSDRFTGVSLQVSRCLPPARVTVSVLTQVPLKRTFSLPSDTVVEKSDAEVSPSPCCPPG